MRFLPLLLLTISPLCFSESLETQIMIDDLRNNKGQVFLVLFDQEEQFPKGEQLDFFTAEITDQQTKFTLRLEIDKNYAFVLVHDENRNEDMDNNFLGLPKEGFAFSKNAKPGPLSPPSFKKSAFSNQTKMTISMNYL